MKTPKTPAPTDEKWIVVITLMDMLRRDKIDRSTMNMDVYQRMMKELEK